jgi:archaellum biogenesis protein FlaJ (TadC family)
VPPGGRFLINLIFAALLCVCRLLLLLLLLPLLLLILPDFLQAARVYFAMVAIGSFLYFFIFAVLPQQHKQYYKEANSCGELMLASWLGSGLHLALLLLLPERQYVKHRTSVTLLLRLVYLLGTARYYGA